MSTNTFTRPSALAPLVMSLAALIVVLGHMAIAGAMRQTDEGMAAHLFQLLIACELPVVAYFAIKWLRRTPRQALEVLALQVMAAAAACVPVWYFNL